MIICHCVGVTERRIRLLALSGHCTPELVAEKCGAGTCCGGCQPAIDEIIAEVSPSSSPTIEFKDVATFRESA